MRWLVSLAMLASMAIMVEGTQGGLRSAVAGGQCALQEGFDLWQGRWRMTLTAPGTTPQSVVVELVELGNVVSGGFDTPQGRLMVSGTVMKRVLKGSFTVSGAGGGPFQFHMGPSFRAFSGTWFKPTTTARGTYLGGGPSRACVLLGAQGEAVVDAGDPVVFTAFAQAEGAPALPPETGLVIYYPEGLPAPEIIDQLNSRCRVALSGAPRVVCTLDALGPGKRRGGVGLQFETAARHAGRVVRFRLDLEPSDRYDLPIPAGQVLKEFKVRVREN